MRRINLFGTGTKSRSDFITSQRRVNVYYGLRQDGEKSKVVLITRPGLTLFCSFPQPIRCLKQQGNNAYAVSGGTLYAILPTGKSIALGTFGNVLQSNPGSMCFNETQLMFVDGHNAIYYPYAAAASAISGNPAITTAELIALGYIVTNIVNFPAIGAQTCVSNDGYGVVEEPQTGSWWISNSQDFSTWNPLMTASMETYSDIIKAVDIISNQVVLFGTKSIEYWVDSPTGTGTFPYQRLDGYQQNYGLAAPFGRVQFMNGIAFLGTAETGQAHVMQITNTQLIPQVISDPDVDYLINTFKTISDCIFMSWDVNGSQFLVVTFPTAGRSFLYEGTYTQSWSEIQSGFNDTAVWNCNFSTTLNNQCLVGDIFGNVYYLDPTNFSDNGAQIKRQWIPMEIKVEGNPFSVPRLKLDMAMGVGALGNPLTLNPTVDLETSYDNGKNWNTPRPMPLGQVGQYVNQLQWRRLGGGRNGTVKLRITCTDICDFVITGAYADVIAGTSTQGR